MDRNVIRGYTFWEEVQGRGSKKGEAHYGTHAWPTVNSTFLVVTEDEKVATFMEQLHSLDMKTEEQGLRAFMWNIEQSI
jgi:nitrogen regulatory protein PII